MRTNGVKYKSKVGQSSLSWGVAWGSENKLSWAGTLWWDGGMSHMLSRSCLCVYRSGGRMKMLWVIAIWDRLQIHCPLLVLREELSLAGRALSYGKHKPRLQPQPHFLRHPQQSYKYVGRLPSKINRGTKKLQQTLRLPPHHTPLNSGGAEGRLKVLSLVPLQGSLSSDFKSSMRYRNFTSTVSIVPEQDSSRSALL